MLPVWSPGLITVKSCYRVLKLYWGALYCFPRCVLRCRSSVLSKYSTVDGVLILWDSLRSGSAAVTVGGAQWRALVAGLFADNKALISYWCTVDVRWTWLDFVQSPASAAAARRLLSTRAQARQPTSIFAWVALRNFQFTSSCCSCGA